MTYLYFVIGRSSVPRKHSGPPVLVEGLEGETFWFDLISYFDMVLGNKFFEFVVNRIFA